VMAYKSAKTMAWVPGPGNDGCGPNS